MKSSKRILVILVGAMIAPEALAVKPLTPLGAVVTLTTDELSVKSCEWKGEVVARPPYLLPDDWQVKLRNQAGELGADTVLHRPPFIGNVRGQAYLCPTLVPATPGCVKDTDCKGDRICDNGVCTVP